MNWRHSSVNYLPETRSWVVDAITFYRNRGHPNQVAMDLVAEDFGLTPRQTRSFAYDEVLTLAVEEYRRLRHAYVRHLDKQARDLAERAAAARARRKQMDLGL